MRTLSSALNTALGKSVTKPGFLIYLGFNSVARFSTQQTISWGGASWLAYDVTVSDVKVDNTSISGSLKIGNLDDAIGSALLNEGLNNKLIEIYGFDTTATEFADVVLLASGTGGECSITAKEVIIKLRGKTEFVYAPREYVGPPKFNQLVPVGKILRIGGQTYRVERN